MPATMRGALHDPRTGIHLHQELKMPVSFPGSALLRVRRTGICGSDLHMNNERKEPQRVPSGHEVAGEIVELPRGETGLKVGDRVAIETIGEGRACLTCWYCRTGQYRHCINRVEDTGGGFAEYMTRRPAGLHRLADTMDWRDGALVEPLAVSVHAVRWGGMRPGETVAVVGSATIGLTAILAARHLGAGKVIASARYPQQAAAARAVGADQVVGTEAGALEAACRAATDGRGADVVFETVGGNTLATLEQSVACARPQGRIVVIGGFRLPQPFDFLTPMLKEVSLLLASCYGIVDGRHDYEIAIDILANGKSPLRETVTHEFPLDRIEQAFATAYDKKTGSIKVHVAI
ncbi:MAG: zinc-binding dehydrogenase [SAR202 cluster bacterium]|nr:zinc-binding dehydrogenase [SAR202 cluster bacterium]